MKTRRQPIAIIGGMGPQASSQLYKLLIEKAALRPDVHSNEDFPHIVIDSLSIADFISDKTRQSEAIELIRQSAERLNEFDPVTIAVACNTAHLFENAIVSATSASFASMISAVTDEAALRGKSVGLLASPTTIESKLYEEPLRAAGLEVLIPDTEQKTAIEKVIRTVIAGNSGSDEANTLLRIGNQFLERGADCLLLGCTELPLVFPKSAVKCSVLDSLDVLATKLVDIYYKQ